MKVKVIFPARVTLALVVAHMVLCVALAEPRSPVKNASEARRSAPAAVSSGYLLKMQDVLGGGEIYVSKDGAKLDWPRADYSLVTSAPDWDVTWYSKGGGTMYSESFAKYCGLKGRTLAPTEKVLPPLKYDYAGIKAARFTRALTGEAAVELGQILPNNSAQKSMFLKRDFYVSAPVDLPRQPLVFINNYFDTPDAGTLPLGIHSVTREGKESKAYSVSSVQKCKLSPEIFRVPAGLKRVQNQRSVAAGVGYKADFDDLVRGLKVGEGFGSR